MLALSVATHLLLGAMVLLLPSLLPRAAPPRWDPVMIGSLVELPAAAGPPPAAAPAPAPTKAAPVTPQAKPVPAPPPPPRPQAREKPQPQPAATQEKPAATRKATKPVQETPSEMTGTPSDASGQADAAGTGATGAVSGEAGIGLRVGDGNFPHAYYLALVKNKLQANYAVPVHPGRNVDVLAVRIIFRLSRDGKLSGVAVDIPSPYPPLDDAALRAVYRSAPFPGLPPAFTGEALDLAVTFDLKPVGL